MLVVFLILHLYIFLLNLFYIYVDTEDDNLLYMKEQTEDAFTDEDLIDALRKCNNNADVALTYLVIQQEQIENQQKLKQQKDELVKEIRSKNNVEVSSNPISISSSSNRNNKEKKTPIIASGMIISLFHLHP